jgi:phage gp29-like protein
MALDLKEAATGSSDGFLAMMEYMDKAISKAVLGQTLSAGGDSGGSYALGMVHREVQRDLLVSDAKQLQGTITRDIIYPLLAINGLISSMAECPAFEFQLQDSQDLKGMADILPKLVGVGMQVPTAWVHQTFGIPAPAAGEAVLEKPAVQPAFNKPALSGQFNAAAASAAAAGVGTPMQTAFAARRTALQTALTAAPTLTTADALVDGMVAQTQPAMDALFNEISAVVAAAGSLIEVQSGLLRLYGGLDPTALTDALALGFELAALRGMSEVLDEAAGVKT